MDPSIIVCRFCGKDFDTGARVPLMIPSCGHSVCRHCLTARLAEKKAWECMEEGCAIDGGLEMDQFPTNHSLLKLITTTSKIFSASSSQKKHCQETPPVSKLTRTHSSFLTKPDEMDSERVPIGLRSRSKANVLQNSSVALAETCPLHGNKLTIVCVEPCQKKICYECGLFGEHKVYSQGALDDVGN